MPIQLDWILISILLLTPSIIADYRRYIYANISQSTQNIVAGFSLGATVILSIFCAVFHIREKSAADKNLILATVCAVLVSAIFPYLPSATIAEFANFFGLAVCGFAFFLTARFYYHRAYNHRISKKILIVAGILALFSNNWSDTWSAILDGQILRALFARIIQLEKFSASWWFIFMIRRISGNGNFNKLTWMSFKISALMVPILIVYAPYSHQPFQ